MNVEALETTEMDSPPGTTQLPPHITWWYVQSLNWFSLQEERNPFSNRKDRLYFTLVVEWGHVWEDVFSKDMILCFLLHSQTWIWKLFPPQAWISSASDVSVRCSFTSCYSAAHTLVDFATVLWFSVLVSIPAFCAFFFCTSAVASVQWFPELATATNEQVSLCFFQLSLLPLFMAGGLGRSHCPSPVWLVTRSTCDAGDNELEKTLPCTEDTWKNSQRVAGVIGLGKRFWLSPILPCYSGVSKANCPWGIGGKAELLTSIVVIPIWPCKCPTVQFDDGHVTTMRWIDR